MAELLSRLVSAQDRLRPYIDRYRSLMSTDPPLTSGVNIFYIIKFFVLRDFIEMFLI